MRFSDISTSGSKQSVTTLSPRDRKLISAAEIIRLHQNRLIDSTVIAKHFEIFLPPSIIVHVRKFYTTDHVRVNKKSLSRPLMHSDNSEPHKVGAKGILQNDRPLPIASS